MQIIKDRTLIDDNWHQVDEEQALPEGNILVPATRLQQQREHLLQREGKLGVNIRSQDEFESILSDANLLDCIAIEFPRFGDGRGYSYARLLRERYHYRGEIRAYGDVLFDQLAFMERCGFNSFALQQGQDIQHALNAAFEPFSIKYQSAADAAQPLYRQL